MERLKITKDLIICFFAVALSNISCKKNEITLIPTTMETDKLTMAKGSFMTSAHTTSGTVYVNKEKTNLNFTNFKTDAGPDLNIYLVSDISKVLNDFVDIGDIKGTKGDYIYNLPVNTDLAKYKYVVIWCVDFKVNFGYAELKQ